MNQTAFLTPTQADEPSTEFDSGIAATPDCKVAYIMSRFPKLTETFVLFEILSVERQRAKVEIFPLLKGFSSGKEVAGAGLWRKLCDHFQTPNQPGLMHAEAAPYVAKARYTPFFSFAILLANLIMIGRRPIRYLTTIAAIIVENRSNANFLWGGLSIFPKCVFFARTMQREGIDHIHAHFANHPATAAFIIHRLADIPYSFTAHGSDLHRHKQMLCKKVDRAAFVIAISSFNRDVITEHCGSEYRDKIRVIHCGVDTYKFRRSAAQSQRSERPQVICVGTLHEVKGQMYLLHAVSRLREQGIACDVHLVGEGKDRCRLEEIVRAQSLESQVTFHGTRTRDQIVDLMQSCDLLVAPSVPTSDGRREGIPVVLMEGMACELPVVASRISGIPELVDSDEVGRLVAPKDIDGLADAIKVFAENPALCRHVGQRARQRIVDHFSLHKNAAQLVTLFQRSMVAK